jgi:chromosomal replication initiation ATPase DnaA
MNTMETLVEQVKAFEMELQAQYGPSVQLMLISYDTALSMDVVVSLVAQATGISPDDIRNKKRGDRETVDAKMIAVFFIFHYITKNRSKIARTFNMKHPSILYYLKTIRKRIETQDAHTYPLIEKLEKRISELSKDHHHETSI